MSVSIPKMSVLSIAKTPLKKSGWSGRVFGRQSGNYGMRGRKGVKRGRRYAAICRPGRVSR